MRSSYIPFGGGPRVCIGNQFALLEGHLLLAAITQRVTFEATTDRVVEPEPLITLRPKGGVRLRVRRRQPSSAELAGRPASDLAATRRG